MADLWIASASAGLSPYSVDIPVDNLFLWCCRPVFTPIDVIAFEIGRWVLAGTYAFDFL